MVISKPKEDWKNGRSPSSRSIGKLRAGSSALPVFHPSWDVLGFGAVAVDDLLYVDEFPHPDAKRPLRAKARMGGGLAGTALVAAARLGARAAYCGVLDDDDLSRFTLAELEREGVDCSLVVRQEGARPYYSAIIVVRSTGSRSILSFGEGVVVPPPEIITAQLIGSTRVLFVDHTAMPASLQAARLARQLSIPVVADIERDDGNDLPELLRSSDHLILGLDLALRLSGTDTPEIAVTALAECNQGTCVVTAGERGCWYKPLGEAVSYLPALKVEVVDTTGCGDVFHGAYAASLARGEDVHTAVRVATIAAGLKATRPGGRAGIPRREQIAEYLSHR